ncbi:Type 1 glutamine amidotransferase-like domain-containing protein [Candidatus Woesearchaeota archaeon]|nr:Type 1 glutamine amidotransferase-like domain-containing protein [Candidatus Woesearchaeota archaeon]
MTKLLLTSTGLATQNITDQFLQIINKPVSQIKIIFIPTASRSEEELKYVDESKKELLDLGISENNIKTLNLDSSVLFEEVEDFDVIYVCGGNTFYLLKKVRETGFDKVIIEFAKTDKLYFGVSAGSILVCPNIDIASPFDENDVNLTDLTGLNLTDVIVSPHYKNEEKAIIDDFKKKSQYEIVPLTDEQALLVVDGETKIVE